MNAIERLRALIPTDHVHYPWCKGHPCTCEVQYDRDALAAVDALYQAAQAELGGDEKIAEYLEIMERNNTDVVDLTKIPRFALAAAVRRVEGQA